MQNPINSIEELLYFFKNTKRHIFTLGPLIGTNLLNVNEFIPNFQIISCNDPYFGAHPFITVPEFIKHNHTCILGTKCEIQLLSNPEVIAYMKAKDPNPNLAILLFDEKLEEICKANGINMWFPEVATEKYLGNKVKIIDELKKAGIPYIPNVSSKIDSYAHFLELTKPFGEKIVVQIHNGIGGWGTLKINNEEDYKKYQSFLENGELFKIMPLKNIKSFAIDVVATKAGTFIGPLLADLIGCETLTPFPSGYCGNEFRSKYFEDEQLDKEIRAKLIALAEKFANYLYENKLIKGTFGFDLAVDLDTNEIYFLEINARMTGCNALSFELYHAHGHYFPLFLYHCAEYLGLDLNLDVRAINDEWIGTKNYQSQFTFIVARPMHPSQQSMSYSFPAGFWKIQGQGVVQSRRYAFRLNELKEDEILCLPNRGFSKINLVLRRRVQDYNFKVTNEGKEILKKFIDLRLKDKQN